MTFEKVVLKWFQPDLWACLQYLEEEENRSGDEVLGINSQQKNHGSREKTKLLDRPRKESRKTTNAELEREKIGGRRDKIAGKHITIVRTTRVIQSW